MKSHDMIKKNSQIIAEKEGFGRPPHTHTAKREWGVGDSDNSKF